MPILILAGRYPFLRVNSYVEVFDDRLDLDLELLEAVPLDSNSAPDHLRSHPFPYLRRAQKLQRVTLRTAILENEYLRVTVLPDLGGRISSLFDKRSQTELFDQTFKFEEGGTRGVELLQGLEFDILPRGRQNRLGPVYILFDESEEIARITLAEIDGALSWHLIFTLVPESAVLRIEGRVFNRSLRSLLYNPSFSAAEDRGNVAVVSASGEPWPNGARFATPRLLMPHQLDVWGVEIVPISIPGTLLASSSAGVVTLEGDQLRFQATSPLQGKMYLRLGDQTLAAELDVLPEAPFSATIPASPDRLAIEVDGKRIMEWPREELQVPAVIEEQVDLVGVTPREFDWLEFDLRRRPAVKVLRAQEAFRAGDWEQAHAHLEDALLVNAEDHLVWLMKAIVARKTGEESEDLLNAHFLAPLEPLFRMESFLSQNHQEKEKSPLVAPIAENPDLLVEGALFLYDLGLYEDLARWVDECLRHREVPMLRYILADTLFERADMHIDAANHLRRANETPINPPYPGRDLERAILGSLQKRYPHPRLDELITLFDRARSQ